MSLTALFPAAQMGVGEGKSIGQWYGPNTVAQVLKYVPGPSRPFPGQQGPLPPQRPQGAPRS